MSKKLLVCIFLYLLTVSWGYSQNIGTEYLIQTTLRNGATVENENLKFTYTIRYKNEEYQLQYIQPDRIFINNSIATPFGKTYYGTLKEGKNKISVQYTKDDILTFDTYYYYLDSQPPFINVKGIYDYMVSSTSHINFKVTAGDVASIPEAISVSVYLNETKLEETNGFYHGLLNRSWPNAKEQEIATNDRQPADNILRIEAIDGIGHQTVKTYHITHMPNTIDYSQLHYLLEKVPGLVSQEPLYKNIGRYEPVGVALDDSNMTLLGTYGGYVVLGHDAPIYNQEGDDFIVNAHWSDQDVPLTSVMVMQDENQNNIPDDTWYRIEDDFGQEKEGRNYTLTYSLSEKGAYKTGQSNAGSLQLEVPVTTPLPTSYLELAKELNWKLFRPDHYTLEGNIKYMHEDPIETLHLDIKGYNIDNAIDGNGIPASLQAVDFIKVYTNTLDTQAGVGSVMPAVNYVAVLNGPLKYLTFDQNQLMRIESIQDVPGDLLIFEPCESEVDIRSVIVTQIKSLVNEDHVFIYPENDLYNHLPYKLEDNVITLLSPYNRAQIEVHTFSDDTTTEINDLLKFYENNDQINTLEWHNLVALEHQIAVYLNKESTLLTVQQEGILELLHQEIEYTMYAKINVIFLEMGNSNDRILHLKWMTDFLSDNAFENIDRNLLERLDSKLLSLCQYTPSSSTLISNEGESILIKPINNIGYNLSIEEFERSVVPEIVIKQMDIHNQKSTNELTFDINFYKDGQPMARLYRPIQYEIQLPSNTDYTLYSLVEDIRNEVPLEIVEDKTAATFTTNQLGRFILVKQ